MKEKPSIDFLILYETPTISKYISWGWLQTIIGRYIAWKVTRKIRRFEKIIKQSEFLGLMKEKLNF